MNSSAENEEDNEIVYDVTRIEELEHFEIGDDTPVLEISPDEINVMEYIEPNDIVHKNKIRKRRNSGRIVHLAHEELREAGPSSQKQFIQSLKDYLTENISEVMLGPTTSASRIFVTSEQSDQHMGLPVFSNNSEGFNTAAQIICTEAAGIDRSQICHNVPQEFTGTGTFIVDISIYSNLMEANLDGLGPWGIPQSTAKFYNIRDGNQMVTAIASSYDWKIICNRYTHPGTDSRGVFSKKIYAGFNHAGIPSALAVIVYDWVGEPHAISVSSSSSFHDTPVKEKAFGQRSWEARLDIFRDENLTYKEYPVFSRICVDFETACRILHNHSNISSERICKQIPQNFRECGTFVLNIAACGGERQLCRDGRDWNKPSGSSRFFRLSEDNNAIRIDANNIHHGDGFDIQVMLKRYETLDPSGLVRKIYISKDKARRLASSVAVVTYIYKPPMSTKNSLGRGLVLPDKSKKEPFPNPLGNSSQQIYDDEMYHLRKKTLELQSENQDRFSCLLDKAETFFERFEQAGNQILMPVARQLVQVWRGTPPQEINKTL